MIGDSAERLLYLLAAVLFITGLRQLQSPETARQGNRISAVGMLIAMVVTLLDQSIVSYTTIVAGIVLASHRTRYDRFGDDLARRPADDPQPGGVGR